MTLLSADLENPFGYGRVIRKGAGRPEVQAIVEEKSATAKQKKIREINSGFYAFAAPALYEHIDQLSTNNAHGEYYLTDMAAILQQGAQESCRDQNLRRQRGARQQHPRRDDDARCRLRLAKCRDLMARA